MHNMKGNLYQLKESIIEGQADIFLESGDMALVSNISLDVRLSVIEVKVGCLVIVLDGIIEQSSEPSAY